MKVRAYAVFLERHGRTAALDDATADRLQQSLNQRPIEVAIDRIGKDRLQRLALLTVHRMIIAVLAVFAIIHVGQVSSPSARIWVPQSVGTST
jgi:hypothetical protein